jgi:chromosomal replication initiation ATPase DnaA
MNQLFDTKQECKEWVAKNMLIQTTQKYSKNLAFPFISDTACINVINHISEKLWAKICPPDAKEITDNPEALLLAICNELDITTEQVRSTRRVRKLVDARHIFAKLCRDNFTKGEFPRMSLDKIGSYINKDHCDILRYIYQVENIKEIRTEYLRVKQKLNL